jgi:hypothetical protein
LKSRFIIALTALLLTASLSTELFGQKTKKTKEKRYETVLKEDLKDYEGTYVGIERDYVIEVRLGPDGQLQVNNIEDGRNVPLTNLKLTGARLTADKTYSGGRTAKFDATFSNRILNGESAFGLLVDHLDVHLDGDVVLNRLFYPRH